MSLLLKILQSVNGYFLRSKSPAPCLQEAHGLPRKTGNAYIITHNKVVQAQRVPRRRPQSMENVTEAGAGGLAGGGGRGGPRRVG